LLQPRRRAEHALLAVVQEAYVHGVSTRNVDDLMKALGLDGVSTSEVSRICGELDPLVEAFRARPLVMAIAWHRQRLRHGMCEIESPPPDGNTTHADAHRYWGKSLMKTALARVPAHCSR
jgi:hypothetical protein